MARSNAGTAELDDGAVGEALLDNALSRDDSSYEDEGSDVGGSWPDDRKASTGEGEQDQGEQVDQQQQAGEQPEGGAGAPRGSSDPASQQQLQQSQQPQQQGQPLPGLKPYGSAFTDQRGNIVDAKGQVIAPSGVAARLWQKGERLTHQNNALTQQNAAIQQQMQQHQQLIQQAQQLAELPKRLGISKEDYNSGLEMLSKFNKDPVGVARDVVARVMALGYNATDILGNSASDAIEMRSLAQMINQVTAPQREQQQQLQQQREREQNATQAYNQFVSRYPDAVIHGDAIAHIVQRHGVTPTDAYYAVREFAAVNQLDFSQPLEPQVDAKRQQPQQQAARPMASSGHRPGNGVTTQPQLARAEDDWASIIDRVLKDG